MNNLLLRVATIMLDLKIKPLTSDLVIEPRKSEKVVNGDRIFTSRKPGGSE